MLLPLMVRAIQELSEQNAQLSHKIETLTAQVENLNNKNGEQ
jgi:FtsZ-binding cell division protein ZapB